MKSHCLNVNFVESSKELLKHIRDSLGFVFLRKTNLIGQTSINLSTHKIHRKTSKFNLKIYLLFFIYFFLFYFFLNLFCAISFVSTIQNQIIFINKEFKTY